LISSNVEIKTGSTNRSPWDAERRVANTVNVCGQRTRFTANGSPCRQPFPAPVRSWTRRHAGPACHHADLDGRAPRRRETTRVEELAAAHKALRLTLDQWMIPLFGDPMASGRRPSTVMPPRSVRNAARATSLMRSKPSDGGATLRVGAAARAPWFGPCSTTHSSIEAGLQVEVEETDRDQVIKQAS
jgi:hypothetical protein